MNNIVEDVINLSQRSDQGFGDKPCSFYLGEEPELFIKEACKLPPIATLLSKNVVKELDDLTDQQRTRLKAIISRFDRWGQLVQGWQRCRCVDIAHCTCVPSPCLEHFQQYLSGWVRINMPVDFQGTQAEIISALIDAVQKKIVKYNFEVDFLRWLTPILADTLWTFTNLAVEPTSATTTNVLSQQATCILERLSEKYGIETVRSEMIVAFTFLSVMRANPQVYDQQGTSQQQIFQQLKDEIVLQIAWDFKSENLPELIMSQDVDDKKMQLRQKLVELFAGLVKS